MAIVEMRVHMDCERCGAKIKKALRKVKGVDSVDIDMDNQKVTVMGWAATDQKKILKKVRNTGKRAELWPYSYNSETQFYYQPPPYSTLVDEQASSVFGDENPHACSIM